jgi:hypothetical protein
LLAEICEVSLQCRVYNGLDLGVVFRINEQDASRSQRKLLQRLDREFKNRMERERRRVAEVGAKGARDKSWKTLNQQCNRIPPELGRQVC